MQILNRQMDFDHLLVCGQVIKFDNATTLIYLNKDKIFFFFFFFFDLGFTALSRIFHLYRADRSSKVGENRVPGEKPPDHP